MLRKLITSLPQEPKVKTLLLVTILCMLAAGPTQAQDSPYPLDSRKQPQDSVSGPRTSPFDPLKESDVAFVTDSAPLLDTGCRFNSARGGGPITFEIRITRFVGPVNSDGTLQNVNQLISNTVISPTATLLMPAFDVDYDAPSGERDRVIFNGHDLGFLTGANEIWKLNSFEVPIGFVKFPTRGANGTAPTPAVNTVQIDIDVNNVGWCTAIDWGTNTFKALSPIILIHGNNSNGGFFDRQGFTGELASRRMLYDNSISLPTASITSNGLALNNTVSGIPGIVKSLGVDSVHLIVHSKGGLDTREYLANYQPANDSLFKILSYTSLSTPHNGSAGADVMVARDDATRLIGDLGRVEFEGFPLFTAKVIEQLTIDDGVRNLTTDFVGSFNTANIPRLPRDTVYNTVAADADTDNSNSIDRSFPDEYAELRAESPALAGIDNPNLGPLNRSRIAINIVYQILRETRTVTLSTQMRCNLLGRNCKQVATITSVPNPTPLGNDTLVTIPSGNGELSLEARVTNRMTFAGAAGRNHSNIANAGVARTVIPWIVSVEKTRGDLR